MFFATSIAALVAVKQLDFKTLDNAKYHGTYSTAISGDLTCGVDLNLGHLYCWNTYDNSAKPRHKKSDLAIYGISIYGNNACALSWDSESELYRIYCTKDIRADLVDWVLMYNGVDKLFVKVELDGDTVCIASEAYIKCTCFSSMFINKPVWKEKKVPKGSTYEISISGKHACVNYQGAKPRKSVCTNDFNADVPEWKTLDAPVILVKISKDKMCGVMEGSYGLTCFMSGKWRAQSGILSTFALDSTHIILGDAKKKVFAMAEFPE